MFRLPKLRFLGRIPTAEYPSDVAVARGKLVWLSAKGLGTGPNPNGPDPQSPNDSDDHIDASRWTRLSRQSRREALSSSAIATLVR